MDPSTFWGRGIQMVVLNRQTLDMGMMINNGMFSDTQGWPWKPPGYRPYLQDKLGSNTLNKRDMKLSIAFYSDQNIPLPRGCTSPRKLSPYVNMELHVEGPGDESEIYEREEKYADFTATHQGCDMDFQQDHLGFPYINGVLEELSWVRFQAMDRGFKWWAGRVSGWIGLGMDICLCICSTAEEC